MTLTKREKVLLQILASVGMFALVLVLLVLPQLQERSRIMAVRSELIKEQQEKEAILNDKELDRNYQEAKDQAQENYDYFYSVLNSYSIDGIVNKLVQDYGLTIFSMQISEYEDATYDFQKLEDEDLKVLVRSNVDLNVSGDYENILKFVDALNEKSPCLSVDTLSITQNTQDATGVQGMTAALRIYIYGIDVKVEGLDTNP